MFSPAVPKDNYFRGLFQDLFRLGKTFLKFFLYP
jgi:hypothetical protein